MTADDLVPGDRVLAFDDCLGLVKVVRVEYVPKGAPKP